MTRLFLLILLAFFCNGLKGETFTYNIVGYEYVDTAMISTETVVEQVLNQSALVNDQKISEKGVQILRKQENKTLMFFISILLLYVFASVRLMFSHQFSGSFTVLKNMNDKRKAQTETDNISLLSFYTLYLLTVGFITYYFLKHYTSIFNQSSPFAAILICITLVTLLFVLKLLGMYLIAWTFDKKSQLSQYFLNVSVIYKVAAIVLFPVSIIILVTSASLSLFLLKVAIIIFAAAIVLRYIRNVSLMKKLLTIHFLHFFMYLCAFEIMPILLLCKLVR